MNARKSSFLLLEVLIAIAILALFSGTFFTNPYRLLQEKSSEIKKLQLCRLSDNALLEIKLELPKIAWSSIGKEEKKAPLRYLPEIHTPQGICKRNYKIYTHSSVRTDEKSGCPYKKAIISLQLELAGAKLKTNHHVVVYAKTAHPF